MSGNGISTPWTVRIEGDFGLGGYAGRVMSGATANMGATATPDASTAAGATAIPGGNRNVGRDGQSARELG